MPEPPPKPRIGALGTIWAIVGIVEGFFFCVVPGIFALRSYRRWRRGSIRRPTFAWVTAWVGPAILVLGAAAFWATYRMPLVQDDFSDPGSGWVVGWHAGWSAEYVDGSYVITLNGNRFAVSYLIWNEGEAPNVAVEADVVTIDGAEAGVGCLGPLGGFVFSVEPGTGSARIRAVHGNANDVIANGTMPASVATSAVFRIRGECRAGFGDTTLAMFVNGVLVAQATEPDTGVVEQFEAVDLMVAPAAGSAVFDTRFDNVLVTRIQPS